MHKPTLSIIMPVYNRKSDLKVTLEALSEISCEVIVIDDGSINVTNCDIVKEYE
jgi:glycosyltransferase involved in cell wall biosynthesis